MEKDKYKIRQARIDDAVRIRELLKTWLPESPYNFGNVNNKKLLNNIVFYIKNSFVIVVEYENVIIGTMAAMIVTGKHVFKSSRILTASSIRACLILYLSFSIWSYIYSYCTKSPIISNISIFNSKTRLSSSC